MKIRYAKQHVSKRGSDIDVGTVFSGRIGNLDSVFLRIHNGIVDLDNPRNTWETPSHQPFLHTVVQDYKELNAEVVIS